MIEDPTLPTISPAPRLPWWMLLIQVSPLIIQLVGEFFLRTQVIPITIPIGDRAVPLFEVIAPVSTDQVKNG